MPGLAIDVASVAIAVLHNLNVETATQCEQAVGRGGSLSEND